MIPLLLSLSRILRLDSLVYVCFFFRSECVCVCVCCSLILLMLLGRFASLTHAFRLFVIHCCCGAFEHA